MSKKKIFVGVLLVFVIAVGVAVLIGEGKFAVLRSSPKISSDVLCKPETRAIVSFAPERVKPWILKLVQRANPKVPEQLIDLTLPREIALVGDVDYAVSEMRLTAFVNEQRLGPVLRDESNKFIASKADMLGMLKQNLKDPTEWTEPGKLTRKAVWKLDRDLTSTLRWQWKSSPKVTSPLKLEGTHAVEIILDNRDGGGIVVLQKLSDVLTGSGADAFLGSSAQDLCAAFVSGRVTVDLGADNVLRGRLTVETTPTADPGTLDFFVGWYKQLGDLWVKDLSNAGIKVTAEVNRTDNVITADYSMSNADKLLEPGMVNQVFPWITLM